MINQSYVMYRIRSDGQQYWLEVNHVEEVEHFFCADEKRANWQGVTASGISWTDGIGLCARGEYKSEAEAEKAAREFWGTTARRSPAKVRTV
jgi:hypothetical protein